MQKDFSMADLWAVLKKAWWKMLLFGLVAVILAVSMTQLLVAKRYSSTCNFLIQNISMNAEYTNTSLLAAADYLANDYISIIKGDTMMRLVSEELETQEIYYKPAQIRGMLSFSKATQNSEFSVTVSSTDPVHAYAVAKIIYDLAPEVITLTARPYASGFDNELGVSVDGYYVDDLNQKTPITIWVPNVGCVAGLREPVRDTTPDSPNVSQNAMLAGAVTAFAVYVLCFLRYLLDTVIHSEEDVKKCTDLPILGVIPKWSETTDRQANRKGGE
ncbi:MAG: hypothetical protein IJY42_01930 [Clostridia bacterium]|nr:hypothetical protein [Clostridia bacterium]